VSSGPWFHPPLCKLKKNLSLTDILKLWGEFQRNLTLDDFLIVK
jgi:hypothetical protein